MADGNVYKLFEELLRPVNYALEGLFYTGVLYGATRVAGVILNCFSGVRTYVLPWGNYSTCDLKQKFGKWVVITGGTSGIGLAYAHEFARRKLNVIIISRSYEDLVNIISDLQSRYSVQAYGIHADFSLGPRVFHEIEEAMMGCEIGILVNNVAVRYDHPQYFALLPHQRLWQLIDENVAAPTAMVHMLLPQMVQRRKGVIINVCSIASCTSPIPLLTNYTATMAYMDMFSQTLDYENRHRGVIVQTLFPGYVTKEKMSPTLFIPSPITYVRHALTTLGVTNRTCGYWPHALQSWLCTCFPRWLWTRLMIYFNSQTRIKSLEESRGRRNVKVFTRKKFNDYIPRGRGSSMSSNRYSDLFLRRTPSPHRRIPSTEQLKKATLDPSSASAFQPPALRRVSREESGMGLTPNRSSTGGTSSSHGSFNTSIPEHPSPTTSTPLSAPPPEPGSTDVFRFSSVGDSLTIPQRSATADSAGSLGRPQTPTFLRKYSRVMVTPSVARVSFHSENQRENRDSD